MWLRVRLIPILRAVFVQVVSTRVWRVPLRLSALVAYRAVWLGPSACHLAPQGTFLTSFQYVKPALQPANSAHRRPPTAPNAPPPPIYTKTNASPPVPLGLLPSLNPKSVYHAWAPVTNAQATSTARHAPMGFIFT